MKLGQQDQAIRLSKALGKPPPLASQWGNRNPDHADHQSTFTHTFVLLPALANYSFKDLV
jgi:hypothetical protein